jgi:hypothetical protein
MSVSVVCNGVAAGDHIRGDLRELANALADHEECGARAMLVEEIKQRGCRRRIRTIVKRERDGERIAGSPPRRPE